jgi:ATP-dependent Clp protease protease subunit
MDGRCIRAEDEEDEEEDRADRPEGQDPLAHKFLKTRQILLSGEINKSLAERVIRQLLVLESEFLRPDQDIHRSPGGDADAGYAIFDMIRFVSLSRRHGRGPLSRARARSYSLPPLASAASGSRTATT